MKNMNEEKEYKLIELMGLIDPKTIMQGSSCESVKIRRIVLECTYFCGVAACILSCIFIYKNIYQSPPVTVGYESIPSGYGDETLILVADPNNPESIKAYPTIYVNGNYYEWRRVRVDGERPIVVAPENVSLGLWPSDPEKFLIKYEYYGDIIHYSGDYQWPKEDREMVSWFDVKGSIYIDPDDDSKIYLYMENFWMEYAVVAFDRIDKPAE